MLFRRFVIFCLLLLIISFIACDDINETYEKKFDVFSMYRDLTIIENGNALRQEDVQLLKNFIDRKILCDSIRWLKRYSYHDLYMFAAQSANSLATGTANESRWKINNMLVIKMVNYSADDGELSFSIQNNSGKNIKSFRADVKLYTLSSNKIGQIDINYQDTLLAGKTYQYTQNDIIAYKLDKYTLKELVVKPNIRRIIFTDTTQFVNPLGSVFDDE